jgi:hypothetical protein
MPSTTAERQRPLDPVEGGLRILLDLLRHVGRPRSVEAEHEALDVLRALRAHDRLPDAFAELAAELDHAIARAGENEIRRLVAWLENPTSWLDRLLRERRCRRARHVLLLLLLLKTVAPLGRHHALVGANLAGLWGSATRLDRLLLLALRSRRGRLSRALARAYLDAVTEVLFRDEDSIVNPAEMSVDEFARWSWPRRVVHLLGWTAIRAGSATGDASRPTFQATRFEFQLARARAYAALARDGGPLARDVLTELGYRDHDASGAPWPTWRLLVAAAVLALLIALVAAVRARYLRYDGRANDLATAVVERYDESAGRAMDLAEATP